MPCSHISSGHAVLLDGACAACLLSAGLGPADELTELRSPGSDSVCGVIDPRQFAPGTIVAERFRITGLIGSGGMGEVYRAEDLKLGEPVAIKFLALSGHFEPERLRVAYEEVRLGRRLSHPNICRIYELVEFEGHPLVVMEYIDGEDLASLLRRIGRPSYRKGVEIARDLCAGLDAIHQQGIVHGDLKPSNVMLDGRGRVRISDFGLSRRIDDPPPASGRGTPCYMAPEQFADGVMSESSDIYALGLVLYEIFTGRRVHDVQGGEELRRSFAASPAAPSTFQSHIDPAVEAAILRCLHPDPAERPQSARAVLTAFPARDPLDAAIAAGETPAPEMVVDAGERMAHLSDGAALRLAALSAGLLAAVVWLSTHFTLYGRVAPERAPAALAENAREIARTIGAGEAADEAWWFEPDASRLRAVAATDDARRWTDLRDDAVPAIGFHYRLSPVPLLPRAARGQVTENDPPMDRQGMVHVALAPDGRLTRLHRILPETEAGLPPPGEGIAGLLRAARIDGAEAVPVTTPWIPPVPHDVRHEWQVSGGFARAALYRGTPVWFELVDGTAAAPARGPQRLPHQIYVLLLTVTLIPGLILARRNMKRGRIDTTAAAWTAILTFGGYFAHRILTAHHPLRIEDEGPIVSAAAGAAVFFAAQAWLGYVALEPYVRRSWPRVIVGWVRLMHGRRRDPLAGREVLFGIAAGLAIRLVDQARNVLPVLVSSVRSRPSELAVENLGWTAGAFGWVFLAVAQAIFYGLVATFLLVLFRVVLRNTAVASAVWLAAVTAVWSRWDDPRMDVPLVALQMAILLLVVQRIGLLALVTAIFTQILLVRIPVTVDVHAFYFGQGLLALAALGILGGYAIRATLRGGSLLDRSLKELGRTT